MPGFPEQSPDSHPKKTGAVLEFLSELLIVGHDGVGPTRGCQDGAHPLLPTRTPRSSLDLGTGPRSPPVRSSGVNPELGRAGQRKSVFNHSFISVSALSVIS